LKPAGQRVLYRQPHPATRDDLAASIATITVVRAVQNISVTTDDSSVPDDGDHEDLVEPADSAPRESKNEPEQSPDSPRAEIQLLGGYRLSPGARRSFKRSAEQLRKLMQQVTFRPGMFDGVRRIAQQITLPAEVFESARRIGEQVAGTQQMRDLTDEVAQMQRDSVAQLLATPEWREQFRQLAQTLRRYYAPNWVGVEIDVVTLFDLARAEGISVVWVPRAALVTELLTASDAAVRRQLLTEHAADIVEDCGTALAAVDQPQLEQYRELLSQAVAAHQAGLNGPGQSMSAVVLTALLQWVYDHGELRTVKTSPLRSKGMDDLLLRDVKVALLIEAAVPAVAGSRDKVPDGELGGFNRHDTLHRVADEAYSTPNAMIALLLATGLLAEANVMLADGRL